MKAKLLKRLRNFKNKQSRIRFIEDIKHIKMTIQQEYLLRHNSIEELLDHMTTEKSTGIKRVFADIGSDENGYSNFKNRYKFFKETIEKDFPELTKDEIIKFNRYYHSYREIYKWSGFDVLLKVLEWEELQKTK